MDDESELYIPSFGKMKMASYVIGGIMWIIIMQLNTTTIEIDPWAMWGTLILLAVVLLFEVFIPRAKNRSPKGTSNVIADTIASGPPQMTIRSEGPFPELGVWILGTIEAPRFGLKIYATATGYAICPTKFAYRFGPNTVFNVDFKTFVDHGTLPPHVYEALRNMIDPTKYKPNIPVAFGLYPSLIHELSKSDRYELNEALVGLGFVDRLKDVAQLVETYAAVAAPFKYEADVLKVEAKHNATIEYLSKQNDILRQEVKDQQSLTAKWKRASLPPKHPQDESVLQKLTGKKDEQGAKDYDNS